jgi:hypothetical protein
LRRFGAQICHEQGETDFWCDDVKLRRQSVLRLPQLRYLIIADDGLLPGAGQTLLVNATSPLDVQQGARAA